MERSLVRRRPKAVAAALALAVVAGLSLASTPAPAANPCGGGVVSEYRYGAPVCVHYSETPPAGISAKRRPSTDDLIERRFGEAVLELAAAQDVADTGSGSGAGGLGAIACLGTGSDGVRVQAIYARASDVADRFDSVAGLIAQYASDADYQLNVSAGLSGSGRRVRYVTSGGGAGCSLDIARVTLTPSGDDTFSSMRTEIRNQGFNRSDRKYLVWADAAVGICGIGEMYGDDSPDAGNLNNRGPSYARVDAPCWDYAEAHELIHTLGGVQDSAPHSTGAGHCVDENDTMCYKDTSTTQLVTLCPSLPSWHVDCNLDDYFNAAPATGSYLATHWNVARNVYLQSADPLPVPPSISIDAPSSFSPGVAVAVAATASVPAGRTYEITWTTSRPECGFSVPTGPASAFSCPSTATGSGEITATVVDSLGMSSSATRVFSLIGVAPPGLRRPSIGFGLSPSRIRRGRTATVTAKLIDPLTGGGAAGVPVVIYYRRSGSSRWTKVATVLMNPSGVFTYSVRPSRSGYYKLVSAGTSSFISTQSSIKRITVR